MQRNPGTTRVINIRRHLRSVISVALLRTVRVYLGLDHAEFELESFLMRHVSSRGRDVTPCSEGERYARWIRLISDFEATGDASPICAG